VEQYINDLIKYFLLPPLLFIAREVYKFNKAIGTLEASFKAIHKRIDNLERKVEKFIDD